MASSLNTASPAREETDLCKNFPATQDALPLALSNGFFFLLPQHIPLLILPLGEDLHPQHQPTLVAGTFVNMLYIHTLQDILQQNQ